MTVKEYKHPIIQKTEDERFVNINGRTFARLIENVGQSVAGELWPILPELYNRAVYGKKLITWDCTLGVQ